MPFEPKYSLTPQIIRDIKAIEEGRGFLLAVRTQEHWLKKLRHECRVRDALSSIQIEGGTLSYEDATALAEDGAVDEEVSQSGREFLNYLRAFEAIDGLCDQKKYRTGAHDVRSLHRILLDGVRGGERQAGRFRQEPVSVGDRGADGEVVVHHQPPSWGEVEGHISDLFEWIESVKYKPKWKSSDPDRWVHPVIIAAIAQHRFVWVHPFVDGNGRTARMLTTLLLYQRGYDFKYLFDLSSYYNKNRDKYYRKLRTVDATHDYTEWIEYFMGGLARDMIVVKKRALQAAGGEPAPVT